MLYVCVAKMAGLDLDKSFYKRRRISSTGSCAHESYFVPSFGNDWFHQQNCSKN